MGQTFISVTQKGIEKQWPNYRPRCPACNSTRVEGQAYCSESNCDNEFSMYFVSYEYGRCKDCDASFDFHFEGVIK